MMNLSQRIDHLDERIATWMNRFGRILLRYSLAVVFIWFGLLKPLGISPAQQLVERTVYWIDPQWFVPLLGWWEVLIGACLLWRPLIRVALLLLLIVLPNRTGGDALGPL